MKEDGERQKVHMSALRDVEVAPERHFQAARLLGGSLTGKVCRRLWWLQATEVHEEVLELLVSHCGFAARRGIESNLDLPLQHLPIIATRPREHLSSISCLRVQLL